MRYPMRSPRSAPIALLVLVTALACGNGNADVPAPNVPVPGEPGPGPTTVTVATSTAAPGTPVTVQARGFTPDTPVEIGIGQPRSEYSVVREARTDADGSLEMSVEVPDWANGGQPHVIVVAEGERGARGVSDPFVVGSPGDRVRVHGEITDEGVECPVLRGPFGTLYTLAASNMEHEPGTEVMVEGTIAEMSTCMQGTTIDVESIEAR